MRCIKTLFVTFVVAIPIIINAAWWNPLSWFDSWSFIFSKKQDERVEVLEQKITELENQLNNDSDSETSTSTEENVEDTEEKMDRNLDVEGGEISKESSKQNTTSNINLTGNLYNAPVLPKVVSETLIETTDEKSEEELEEEVDKKDEEERVSKIEQQRKEILADISRYERFILEINAGYYNCIETSGTYCEDPYTPKNPIPQELQKIIDKASTKGWGNINIIGEGSALYRYVLEQINFIIFDLRAEYEQI